jgi:hypothetical protein
MRRALGIALLVLGVTASAEGATIFVDSGFIGVGVTYMHETLLDGPAAAILGSVQMSGATGTGISSIDGQVFEAFCVEILGPIFQDSDHPNLQPEPVPGEGQVLLNVAEPARTMTAWSDPAFPGSEPLAGARAAWLYENVVPTLAPRGELGDVDLVPLQARIQRTALQMAIWEVLYDSGLSVEDGAGLFYLPEEAISDNQDAVRTQAMIYLGLVAAVDPALLGDATWLETSDCGVTGTGPCEDVQDFIGPRDQANPVPEPATALLLATGTIGLVASRRRRTKT